MKHLRLSLAMSVAVLSASAVPAASHSGPQPGRRVAREEDRFDFSHRGTNAPTVVLLDAKGHPVAIGRFRGHPVLVNLWATWCVPCIKELPALDQSAAFYHGKVSIIAVSQDAQGAPLVLPFWRTHGWTSLTLLMDARNGLGNAVNMGGLPATILYDSRGHEVWRASGGTDWSSPLARRMIGMAS